MKLRAVVTAILAISVASSGTAFAQGRGDREDRGGQQERRDEGRQQERRDNDARNQRDRREADANMRRERGSYNGRGPDGRGPPGQRMKEERREERREGYGAGPNHAFYRGDRLPMEYRHYNYVVDDWRGHQLSAPPRGYHWVQTGGDYVLVAIATGIIAQLILGR